MIFVLVFSVCWSPLSRDGKGPTYSSVCNQLILKMREGEPQVTLLSVL